MFAGTHAARLDAGAAHLSVAFQALRALTSWRSLLLGSALLAFISPQVPLLTASAVPETPSLVLRAASGASIGDQALFADELLIPGTFVQRELTAQNDGQEPAALRVGIVLHQQSGPSTPAQKLDEVQITIVDVTHDQVLYGGSLRELNASRPTVVNPGQEVLLRLAVGLPSQASTSAVAGTSVGFDVVFEATPQLTDSRPRG